METTKTHDRVQSECVEWYWNQCKSMLDRMRLFAVNNNSLNKAKGAISRALGVLSGVSDLCFVGRNKMVFLECKVEGDRQKERQGEFEESVKVLGHDYHIFGSLEEFKELVKKYL